MISRLKDTLLLVGDGKSERSNLREVFAESYNLLEAENIVQALMLLKQNVSCIAAVLADVPLSEETDLRELAENCMSGSGQEAPLILFVEPSGTGEREERAFSMGATDVVYKPYTPASVQRRIQIILDTFTHKWNLEKLAAVQGETIRHTNQVVMDALSAVIEHRSTESGNHVLRIRRFTKILLEEVAASCPEYHLTDIEIDRIASASALHDIGKISIPDAILNKPGKLTEEEFEVMKTHTTVGSQIVQTLDGIGDVDYLRYAYNIALYHHERWDGRGYPVGLAGDEIPICAQVVGIADAFDALTTPRVYKPAFAYDRSISMILNGECGQFAPKLLECFKHVSDSFIKLAVQYSDGYTPSSDEIAVPLPSPVQQKPKLDSLQLSHMKYQTLLHYANDTVIEFDLDRQLYHVVYNPNPDFEMINFNASYEDVVSSMFIDGVHPDDRKEVAEIQSSFDRDSYEHEYRKKVFRCRMYSPSQNKYELYEITLLRVNTQNREQRIILAVFHRLSETEKTAKVQMPASLHQARALYGLVSSALRCRTDKGMTIDEGARDLYLLTGYTEEEIKTEFGGRYADLIFSADRPAFIETIQKILDTGGKAESEYRLVRKDGTTIWVLDKSRAYAEEDGQIYVYHAVRDNSKIKAEFYKLQTTNERNQVVIDRSGGIIFDWDLQQDKLYCSPKWEEHFGYPPVSDEYSRQLGIVTHFHPDDLPVIRSTITQIKDHLEAVSVDVRIANSDARYLWTRITATAYLDENGTLTRIIGIMQDIDAMKRAELALKEQAARDPLTKLLNKASTQQLVSEYLSDRESDGMSAMLILDLDNFKLINDNYGHLYGDAVLTQAGAALKKLFRSHDFIGRIGGDEFLIFMRDIPNEDLVHSRCELLLETFRSLMEQNAPGLSVSCSIGAALVPDHGTGYTDLFRHADESLYVSKKKGKNTYTIYDPQKSSTILMDGNHLTTRIDSDEEPGMADASFVHYVFKRLYESDNVISSIDDILTYVGEQLQVSRVYIFENNDDNTACSNTFEWCNEGVTAEKDNLQNVSYINDIPGWPEVYDEKGVFYCTDITQLAPQFRDILAPQGIKSILQCAIMDQGVFRGYVGFDECSVHRMWTREQINILEFLAGVLAMFLLKKRSQDKVLEMVKSMRRILDKQEDWIYVIEPDTFDLKFINAKIKKLVPESDVGMTCYRVFMKRESPCENCPAVRCSCEEESTAVIENTNLGVIVKSSAAEINWNGKSAYLVTCRHMAEEQN